MNTRSTPHRSLAAACALTLARALALAVALALVTAVEPANGQPSPPGALGQATFFPGLYYPAVADSAAAEGIVLRPGETRSGLLISLVPAGGRVEGRVLGGSKETEPAPLQGAYVEAVSGRFRAGGLTGLDGSFAIAGVPAGAFRVRVSTDHSHSHSHARNHVASWAPGCEPACTDSAHATVWTLRDAETLRLSPILLPEGVLIGGTVHRGATHETLGGVDVGILELAPDGAVRRSIVVRTDAEGRYSQGGLPPGRYKIEARTEGTDYIPEFYGGARTEDAADAVEFAAGTTHFDLDITPDPGGSIHGQIRGDGSGEAIVGALVEVTETASRAVHHAFTGTLGIFEVKSLPSGSYLVYAPVVRRFYPDAVHEDKARPVRVLEPESVFNIDISGTRVDGCQVQGESAGLISGTVVGGFKSATPATIVAWNAERRDTLSVAGPGGYVLPCLLPGRYRAAFLPRDHFRTQYHPKVDLLSEALEFEVVAPDTVLRVDFQPKASVILEGRVIDGTNGQPLIDVRVTAREDTSAARAEIRTDATGNFRIEHLADGTGLPWGRWTVRAESTLVPDPDLTPLRSIRLDARVDPEGVLLEWVLPFDGEWRLHLDRMDGDQRASIHETELFGTHGAYIDRMPNAAIGGLLVYELRGVLIGSDWEVFGRSDPISPGLSPGATFNVSRLLVRPAPARDRVDLKWNGVSAGERVLRVFDASGRERRRWSLKSHVARIEWDLRDPSGRPLPSGIYFVRLEPSVAGGAHVPTLTATLVIER